MSVFPGDLAMEAAGYSHGVGSHRKALPEPRPFLLLGHRWGHQLCPLGSRVSKAEARTPDTSRGRGEELRTGVRWVRADCRPGVGTRDGQGQEPGRGAQAAGGGPQPQGLGTGTWANR